MLKKKYIIKKGIFFKRTNRAGNVCSMCKFNCRAIRVDHNNFSLLAICEKIVFLDYYSYIYCYIPEKIC